MEGDFLISILMTCYNHEQFIEDAIKSILGQTYNNLELVICDDCSSDDTVKIIEYYNDILMEHFPSYTFIKHNQNEGVTRSLNQMIYSSKGKYIKWASGDDILDARCIEKVVDYITSNANPDVIVANGYQIGANSRMDDLDIIKSIYYEPPDFSSNTLVNKLYQKNFIFDGGVTVRRSLFETFGYYDENIMVDDWYIYLLFATNGVRFDYLNEAVVYYRLNENSMTSLCNNLKLENRRYTLYFSYVYILSHFKGFVKKEMWADTTISLMLEELSYAKKMKLNRLRRTICKDLMLFRGWCYLSVSKKWYFIRNYFYILRRKF